MQISHIRHIDTHTTDTRTHQPDPNLKWAHITTVDVHCCVTIYFVPQTYAIYHFRVRLVRHRMAMSMISHLTHFDHMADSYCRYLIYPGIRFPRVIMCWVDVCYGYLSTRLLPGTIGLCFPEDTHKHTRIYTATVCADTLQETDVVTTW